MVEHFRDHIRRWLGVRATAMLVTSSRLQAMRYKQAFGRYMDDDEFQRAAFPILAREIFEAIRAESDDLS